MNPPLTASPAGVGEVAKHAIGYGPGVAGFKITLPPGRTTDTGFFKVIVSTKYLDLKWLAQGSPLKLEFQPMSRLRASREVFDTGHVWDTFNTFITIKASE